MIVLGIETSCDETAAAVVSSGKKILSNIIHSQLELHRPYGGVVPENAARNHIEILDTLIERAMADANVDYADLSGVAVTAGPGLIGGLIVGVMTAKAIASVHNLPIVAVNHLEGHALTARLTSDLEFPYLMLLVSGGHCQYLAVEHVGTYHLLGSTLDDALGEAFDKTAKMTGLPYPGGPEIERHAITGDPKRFSFPKPLLGREGCDLSFSGLKTAIRQTIQSLGTLSKQDIADISACFQHTVAEVVVDRTQHAIARYRELFPHSNRFVAAGGVAANSFLREALKKSAVQHGFTLTAPPAPLCTDNAAMIAWAGLEHLRLGKSHPLDFDARARWPLSA